MSVNSNNGNNFQSNREAVEGSKTDQEATTKMVDDGSAVVAKMAMPVDLNAGLMVNATLGINQDIDYFLAKPFPVSYGTFSASDTSGTFPIVRVFESLSALDMYKSKTKGHLGIRATVILKITFNAQRFQQGRYILAFMPLVTNNAQSGYQNSNAKSLQLRYNKSTVTQLPHVEFDLNCDSEATLEIPYVSPYTHYSLLDNYGDIGSYFLYPYSPLATGSGGSANCQYTIWASFKDVQLVAPTLPQMAKSKGGMRPVGLVKKRGTVTEMEQKAAEAGPLEQVLTNVSKVADHLSQIPLLGLVARQTAWATAIAAKAASVFGWSKPLDLDHACRMYHNYAPFIGNCDTMDMSLPLSWMSTNSVETLPGFAGTDIDETAIDYVKSIPAYLTEFTWTTAQITENQLYLSNLAPGSLFNTYTDAAGSITIHTPVSWVANMFKYYKGSLRYTFKIVKTEFHSGRLMLSYAPRQTTPVAASVADSSYLLREVMDIRMGSEFSFVIPYASVQTYRDTNQPYGCLQLNVLNELVAPPTVSSSVTILVEVSAAPDMQFAFPAMPRATVFIPTNIQMDYQMDTGGDCVVDSGILANGAMFDDKLSAARFCVGEKIMSLMQLVKLPTVGNGYTNFSDGPEIQFLPFAINSVNTIAGSGNTAATTSANSATNDWYDYIAAAYGLSRGGARLKVLESASLGGPVIVAARLYPMTGSSILTQRVRIGSPATYFDFSTYDLNGFPCQYFQTTAQPAEVQVPQYGKFHSRVNSELLIGGGSATAFGTLGTPTGQNFFVNFQNRSRSFQAANTQVFRSASDDFQLGYFLAVPPYRNVA